MSDPNVPLDQQVSALEQVPQMTAEHTLLRRGRRPWDASANPSGPPSELGTLLLAVNYELLGYTPQEAWMFARREQSARPGRLDG